MKELVFLLPEVFLLITLAFVLVAEITYHGERVRLIWWTALVGLGAAFLQLVLTYRLGSSVVFSRTLTIDGFGLFFKLVLVIAATYAVTAVVRSEEIQRQSQAEVLALVVGQTLAGSLVVSASHFGAAFAAMAFLHAISYYLFAYGRKTALSTEAAVKFLVFSAFSLLFLLYGAAILFAHVKTLNFYDIHRTLVEAPLSASSQAAVFFLFFFGIGMATAAFPMHFWMPDALQGAPTPVSGFLAISLRASTFGLLIRMGISLFSEAAGAGRWQVLGAFQWPQAVSVIAGATILLGALLSWRQTSAKRLLACLGLVQAGFSLIGFLVLDEVGLSAFLFSLAVDMFAWMAATAILSELMQRSRSDRLKDLAGSIWGLPAESVCLIFAIFSLMAVPPSPGFLGRFSLFGAALRHQNSALVVVALFGWVLSVVGGARLIYALWGEAKKAPNAWAEVLVRGRAQILYLVLLAAPLFGILFFAESLLRLTSRSLGLILW